MQEIATYLNDNYNRFQIAKRQFENDKGETINYDQLQVVTGVNEQERTYDIKLSRDAKILLRSEADRTAKNLNIN